ncbi:S-adenosylmethionine-dependent methyltransferase Rv2258c-like [Diadema setosum]|uniref:S-adenosylmethionine-dependent methyltransferase Rv2258c-like n=1 Tax=Diadema setosum TaxID=31175 RepID=UPI003B3B4ABF
MEQPTRILSMLKTPPVAVAPPLAAAQLPGGKPMSINSNVPEPMPRDLPPGMAAGPPVGADGETIMDFGRRMAETINAGFLTLSIAVGRQTGLFDALGSFRGQPKTSQEIADRAGLKERYVREWLGAMVTSRIVEAEGKDRFFLPPHRAFFLGREGPGEELTILACALPVQSQVFENVTECFRRDGPRGVPYDHFDKFHGFMSQCSNIWWGKNLVESFIPSVPGLREKLDSGISVLDVGCGEGGASILLAKQFCNSRFVGVDICHYAISQAKAMAVEQDVQNVDFQVMDAHMMPDEWANKFDYVLASDSLHDMAHVSVALEMIQKVLTPDGYLSVLEVNAHSDIVDNMAMPFASTFYTNSLFHCMTVSLAAEGGEGHGNMWGREKTTAALRAGGFTVIDESVPEGWFNIHYVCKQTDKTGKEVTTTH